MEELNALRRAVEDMGLAFMGNTKPDPRVDDWLFMSSWYPTLFMTAGYLVFSLFIGPWLMRDRKPFEFTNVMAMYNLLITGLNVYIVYEMVYCAYIVQRTSLICAPVVQSTSPIDMRIAAAVWWYYFSKCLEFLDTFFFILRKKNNQITFLHVFHHSTMFPIWWIGARYVPGGSSVFGASLNAGVHVLMYLYYFIAALGDKYKPYLWWKKYMTTVQLTQFGIVFINTGGSLAYHHMNGYTCDFPEWMAWALLFYCTSMIVLFSIFFRNEYLRDAKDKQKKLDSVVKTSSVSTQQSRVSDAVKTVKEYDASVSSTNVATSSTVRRPTKKTPASTD